MSFVDPFVRLRGIRLRTNRNRHSIYILMFSFCLLGMPAVLETILDHVDYKSLARVQRVCKMWNETVNTGPYWHRKLNDQVSFITQTVMCCVQF